MRLALVVLVALTAGATFSLAGTELAPGTATLTSGTRQVTLQVEIARTAGERQRGLMGRRSLAPKAGMIFVFPESTRGPFWMKNTLIPLSAAFYDGRGKILRILRMEPCRADPCRLYDPGVAYRGVLEVNAGSFDRWGIRAGGRITVRSPSG
jgi:uncharacterized protein